MTTSEFPALQRTTRQNDNLGVPDWLSITFQSSITPHSSCYKSASLRTRGSGPSSTTSRPGSFWQREGGLAREVPLVLPAAWPPVLGGLQDLVFQLNTSPVRRLSAFQPFLHPCGVFPDVGCIHGPNEIISGLMETEAGASSSDIIRFPISEKIQSSILRYIYLTPQSEFIKNIILNEELCRWHLAKVQIGLLVCQ